MAHDHGDTFETVCLGTLYLAGSVIGYTNDSGVHTWEVPVSAIEEAKKNSFYGSEYQAFHIELETGSNFNLVAVTDQLQYQSPDMILISIHRALEGN